MAMDKWRLCGSEFLERKTRIKSITDIAKVLETLHGACDQ